MQTPIRNHAVVHFFAWESWPATTRVAAVPIITRALICGRRIGIDHFFLWSEPQSEIAAVLASDSRTRDCWEWLVQAQELKGEGRILIYGPHTLVAPQVLQEFHTRGADAPEGLVLLQDQAPTRIAMLDRCQLRQCPCQAPALDRLLAEIPTTSVRGFIYPLIGPKKQAERALLDSLQSPLEGQIDVYFNRPLGRLLTPILVKWRVHPNIVSIAAIVIGLVAAALFFALPLLRNHNRGVMSAIICGS